LALIFFARWGEKPPQATARLKRGGQNRRYLALDPQRFFGFSLVFLVLIAF